MATVEYVLMTKPDVLSLSKLISPDPAALKSSEAKLIGDSVVAAIVSRSKMQSEANNKIVAEVQGVKAAVKEIIKGINGPAKPADGKPASTDKGATSPDKAAPGSKPASTDKAAQSGSVDFKKIFATFIGDIAGGAGKVLSAEFTDVLRKGIAWLKGADSDPKAEDKAKDKDKGNSSAAVSTDPLKAAVAATDVPSTQTAVGTGAGDKAKTDVTATDGTKPTKKAEGTFGQGLLAGIDSYVEQAKLTAAEGEKIVGNFTKGMEDLVVNFATTGKASIKDFAKTFIAEILRMAAQAAVSGLAKFIGTGISFLMGAGSESQITGGTDLSLNTTGPSMMTPVAAHGMAVEGGVRAFAKGSAFTNAIVSTPTRFGMAGGRGVMGEGGPEGILPLARTSSGDLGVRSIGGSAGGGNVFNLSTSVTVSADGNKSESSGSGGKMGQSLGDVMNAAMSDLLQREMQQGGLLWNWRNGYA